MMHFNLRWRRDHPAAGALSLAGAPGWPAPCRPLLGRRPLASGDKERARALAATQGRNSSCSAAFEGVYTTNASGKCCSYTWPPFLGCASLASRFQRPPPAPNTPILLADSILWQVIFTQ
eukprot:scaffold133701_cov60-Phaeocystis_antarctica.AAC.1